MSKIILDGVKPINATQPGALLLQICVSYLQEQLLPVSIKLRRKIYLESTINNRLHMYLEGTNGRIPVMLIESYDLQITLYYINTYSRYNGVARLTSPWPDQATELKYTISDPESLGSIAKMSRLAINHIYERVIQPAVCRY